MLVFIKRSENVDDEHTASKADDFYRNVLLEKSDKEVQSGKSKK